MAGRDPQSAEPARGRGRVVVQAGLRPAAQYGLHALDGYGDIRACEHLAHASRRASSWPCRLPADSAAALEDDLTSLLDSMNRAGPGSLVVPSEYLEVVVTRA